MNRLITILFLGMTAIIMQAKTDKEQIEALYREMYEAMVAKDTVTLNHVHADDFVLIHMTGMRQSKAEYIRAIADGTLNYYSVEHEEMDIAIKGQHRNADRKKSSDCCSVWRESGYLEITFAFYS